MRPRAFQKSHEYEGSRYIIGSEPHMGVYVKKSGTSGDIAVWKLAEFGGQH